MNTTINMNNTTDTTDTTTTAEFKTWLKQKLNEGTMKVTFIKQDGTPRVMNCTTNPKVIPETASTRKSVDIMTVFDVDVKDWRSFRWDRVKIAETVAAY